MAAGPRATMDFFAAQAAARRRTAVLVAWFALAWAGTVLLVWASLGLAVDVGLAAQGANDRADDLDQGDLAAVGANRA